MSVMMNDAIYNNLVFLFKSVNRLDLSPAVLSVIATEMYFRGSFHRLIEYCAWVILWFIYPKRLETLSVGVAQIQLYKWVEMGYMNSLSPSYSNFKTVFNIDINYSVCHNLLSNLSFSEVTDPRELSSLYTGQARIFHVKVIEFALSCAEKLSQTKVSRRSAKEVKLS